MNDSASGDTAAPQFGGRSRPELGRIVVSEDELQGRVAALGKEITADYAERAPLLVGVLKGAFLFMSDLARCIDLPVELDFMAVSSHGSATKTSGVVRIIKDLDTDLTDRHVLIVEDIVDSGLTLSWIKSNLESRSPASVEICTLLRKPEAAKVEIDVKWVSFDIANEFVVGYGLDVDECYRNLPYVCEYAEPDH